MSTGGRILTVVISAMLIAALIALLPLPTATADPIEVWKITIVDPTGIPFAEESILAVVWNETANCAIAYFKGTTDSDGNFTMEILVDYTLYTPDEYVHPGTYNITIAIEKYGRWMLLHWASGLDWTTLFNTYVNQTVTADHWWILNFSAWTDPDLNGVFDTPLYFKDPEAPDKEDLASFRIYWNDTRELIEEIWAAEETNVAEKLFNISDTELEIEEIGPGCFIFTAKNVTLYKEVYWNLYENPEEFKKVLVGKEILAFNSNLMILNITDLVPTPDEWRTIDLTAYTDHIVPVEDRTYTVFFRVTITDPCGEVIDKGDMSTWKVFFQTTIDTDLDGEEESVILRSGAPDEGIAPARGYTFGGATVFWLPDITYVYGKDYNVTLNIVYYNVLVFTATLPTNETATYTLADDLGTYMTHEFADGIHEITAMTSVVKTRVVVKDSQPTSQPLIGARIVLEHVFGDPIYTGTGDAGAVFLPPFTTTGAGEGAGDFVITYTGAYFPDGYLPVPFTYRTNPAMVYNYSIRVFWKMPAGEEWVDVTPDDNIFSLNITKFILEECATQEFAFYAKVYHVKIKVLDLCNEPITSMEYPGATVLAYMNGRRIGAVGLGVDGTIDIAWVPAGTFKFRLIWKGILMRANITEPEEPTIEVDKNIGIAKILVFPVGNLNITATMWDIDYPLYNLSVTLQYLKDGKVMYEEPATLTDCYGRATFTQVPLRPLTIDEGAGHTFEIKVLIYTTEDTPYIRPQDAGIKVAEEVVPWDELEIECWNEYIVPTWIYSFKLWAVDHEGNVLTTFKTDIGDIPVTVVLVDSAYGKEPTCCPDICPPPGCVCPPPGEVLVDFRIFNMTGATTESFGFTRSGTDEAKFVYYSQQFFESDPEADEIGLKPHLFVAGANYTFMVFQGGVLVYNYTITLPKPYETLTVFFNETDYTTWTATGEMYNYTWILDGEGRIAHPILTFIGSKSWKEGGARADSILKLVTWTQTLKVYTLSNTGEFLVPKLNLTLARTDTLNWTIMLTGTFDDVYGNLTTRALWADKWTNYLWNAVDEDGDGVIEIQVPVWLPSRDGTAWIKSIKFGAEIADVYVLAGSEWGSIDVPDTPEATTLSLTNASNILINHTIFGYIINWNYTDSMITVDPTEFYPTWFKNGVEFRGNDTYWIGDFWNMTYWSGASKVVNTITMEGFCVVVEAPIDAKGTIAGLPDQPVKATAVGETDEELTLGTLYTDSTGTVKFEPGTVGTGTLPNGTAKGIIASPVAYKFNVTGLIGPEIDYRIETWQNFEKVLKPYDLEPEDVVDYDILSTTVKFEEDHNKYATCVELQWGAIMVLVEDWSG
ncbi:MAG: hypothetical protein DRJ98_07075, partial [Thermoprotei archaeon]